MQFVGSHVIRPTGIVVDPDLADGHRTGVVVDDSADATMNLMHACLVESWIFAFGAQ